MSDMARLANDDDEKRAKHVEAVAQRFADHGADRAALLAIAFFASEAASRIEDLSIYIERAARK